MQTALIATFITNFHYISNLFWYIDNRYTKCFLFNCFDTFCLKPFKTIYQIVQMICISMFAKFVFKSFGRIIFEGILTFSKLFFFSISNFDKEL